MSEKRKKVKVKLYGLDKNHAMVVLSIVVLSVIIFLNTFDNSFVYDDIPTIVDEEAKIKDWGNLSSLISEQRFRFIRTITYMIDYHFWELNPFGYHLTNLILHILCAISLYGLCNSIFGDRRLSLMVGLLFAAHPIHTEAVTAISHRKEMLAMLFYVLAVIFYLERDRSKWFILSSIISYILALFSKEAAAIALPIMIIVYHFCYGSEHKFLLFKRNVKYLVLSAVIMGLFLAKFRIFNWISGIESILEISHGAAVSYSSILYTVFKAFPIYMKLLFLPFNLCIDHTVPISESIFESSVLTSLAFFAAVLLFTAISYKYSRGIFFGLMWILVNWLPISNIVPSTTFFVAERYLYVPSVGFCIVLGIVINRLYDSKGWKLAKKFNKSIAIVILLIILGLYSVLTIQRNADWKSGITLWSKTIQQNPESVAAHNHLGLLYKKQGRYNQAISEFRKASEINPRLPYPYFNMGNLYLEMNFIDEAILEFQEVLKRYPLFVRARINLGIAYGRIGMYDEAILELKKSLEMNPNSPAIYYNIAIIYEQQGLYDNAIREYQKVLNIDPGFAGAYFNLGNIYFRNVMDTDSLTVTKRKELIEKAIYSYRQFQKYWTGDPRMSRKVQNNIQILRRETD